MYYLKGLFKKCKIPTDYLSEKSDYKLGITGQPVKKLKYYLPYYCQINQIQH